MEYSENSSGLTGVLCRDGVIFCDPPSGTRSSHNSKRIYLPVAHFRMNHLPTTLISSYSTTVISALTLSPMKGRVLYFI